MTDRTAPGLASFPIPAGAEERLADLRRLYVPETLADARLRMSRERPSGKESFEQAASRRLRELRALVELAERVHSGSRPSGR